MPDTHPPRIAFFVSSHGFGHAARACAVMQALRVLRPECELRVYTETPEWFFRDAVGALDYRVLRTDIGLVQHSPLLEDIPATLEQLAGFMPFASDLEQVLAAEVADRDLVVCDIAPLGLRAAAVAGVPAVLIENFTWDWIYQAYWDEYPRLAPYVDYLAAINRGIDVHLQAEPVCQTLPGTTRVAPIARHLRETRAAVRERLGVALDVPLVLVSMGGVPAQYPFLERLRDRDDAVFLIPGAAGERRREGALLALPTRSDFYHPDLVNACDALVCKAGYSTLAEAFQAGVPMAWFPRERFPESPVLDAFIERKMPGVRLLPSDWDSGAWIDRLPDLLALSRRPSITTHGADQVVQVLLRCIADGASAAMGPGG